MNKIREGARNGKELGVFSQFLVLSCMVLATDAVLEYFNITPFPRLKALDSKTFSSFRLKSKDAASPSSAIFALKPYIPRPWFAFKDISVPVNWREQWDKALWSIEIKQPDLQISRAYTPLPPLGGEDPATLDAWVKEDKVSEDHDDKQLKFLIRRETQGEVSGWLHRLPIGEAMVEVRGPKTEYAIDKDIRQVLFLAGGTGIAPAMQLAYALRGRADMAIVWANRRREECVGAQNDGALSVLPRSEAVSPSRDAGTVVEERQTGIFDRLWPYLKPADARINLPHASTPSEKVSMAPQAPLEPGLPILPAVDGTVGLLVQQLNRLKSVYASNPDSKLTIDYFVDDEGSYIDSRNVQRFLAKTKPPPVQCQALQRTENQPGRKVIFVAGPDGFVDYWCGRTEYVDMGRGRIGRAPLGGVFGQMALHGWEVIRL